MARRRRGRPIDGILVLDKPTGITSNGALQTVKRLYFAAKAGHTGSLDPLATGVLPICFGEATKFSQYLLDSDKIYRSTFRLGETRNTGDADGEVLESRDTSELTQAQVEEALGQFRGEISQIPSMFSAIKKDGQPLYKLAREGKEIEREARQVTIFGLELEAFRPGPQAEVDIWVHCSKGTYVRSIAEDLGAALGCGAHVAALRRVQAGPFSEDQQVTMATLEALRQQEAFAELDQFLQPVDSGLGHLTSVTLGESAGYYLMQGQPVLVPKSPTEGMVTLYLESGEFVGVGEILDDGRVAPRRLVTTAQQ